MKNRIISIILIALLVCSICGCAESSQTKETSTAVNESAEKTTVENTDSDTRSDINMRVGSLKGPTTMGIINMMYDDSLGAYKDTTDFTMVTAADELVASVVKGEVDIALVPANVAAILYKKTEQKIKVIDINTLGVLYIVEKGNEINDIKDLEGKKLYLTGKGTTPDYVLQFLLNKNGVDISKVDLEYCSEATEVITAMDSDESAIGLLPQPFVTTAIMKDDSIRTALDLTLEWDKVSGGSKLVTGVTIVRTEFLENNPEAVEKFMKAHKESVSYSESHLDEAAARIEEKGIVKAPVVMKAYEKCHITYLDGKDMQSALAGYIQALLDIDASTVGGSLPDNGFYYINE